MKKLALTSVILMALVCVWGWMSSGVSITINGNAIHSPFDSISSIWELVITGVVLFCVSILLVFIFAGVGLILLGVFAFVMLIIMGVAFPFLLPLLIPLFIVLLFCLSFRMNGSTQQSPMPEPAKGNDAERTKQVKVVGWTAGVSAFFAMLAIDSSPSWPVAVAVFGVAAMVSAICYFILKREK